MKKKGLIIFFLIALIIGIALAIIIPSIKTFQITSFDGKTTFKITEFNLGKNLYSDDLTSSIKVNDGNAFYEKYIKQYTVEDVPSNEESGYIFYGGASFGYYIQDNIVTLNNYYVYDGSSLSYYMADFYNDKVNGIMYYIYYDEYQTVLNIFTHIDERYYEKKDGDIYVKCYDETDNLTDCRFKLETIEANGTKHFAIDPTTPYYFN